MSPSRGRRSYSSSPKRRPLQERSPSQNNARSVSRHSRPSIRIVEDDSWISQARVYQKSALPSKPAQVFAPGYARSSSRPVSVAGRASSFSSNARSSNEALVLPLQWRKANRLSGSTGFSEVFSENFSEGDTLVNSSSTFKRQSLGSITPGSPTFPDDSILEAKLASAQSENLGGSRSSTIRPVVPSSPSTSVERTELSEISLPQQETSPATSTDSLRTMTARRYSANDNESTNFEIIASSPIQTPHSSKYRGLQHASSAKKLPKPIFPPPDNTSRQSLSEFSFVSSYISIDEPLASSTASSDQPGALRSALASGLTVQYPNIPSRSSSTSRPSDAESQGRPGPSSVTGPSSPASPGSSQSSSQPSTVHRVAGTTALSNYPEESSVATESSDGVPAWQAFPRSSDDSVAIPPPLFQRNGRAYTPDSQELQESHDTVPELQSPHLRTVRSNRSFFSVFSGGESRPSSATESVRGSVFERGSYMESTFFPAWARSYYRRGSSSLPAAESTASVALPYFLSPNPNISDVDLTIRPPTPHAASRTPSLDYVPATLYAPRKRPRQQQMAYRPPTTESVVSFVEPEIERPLPALPTGADPATPVIPGRPRGPRTPPKAITRRAASTKSARRSILRSPILRTASGHFTRTPRLGHDRRSAGVLTAWPAPSLASSIGGLDKLFSRQGNRQIVLFVVGFAVPFAWMLAAFLPLPPRPDDEEEGVQGQHTREQAWRKMRGSHMAPQDGVPVAAPPGTIDQTAGVDSTADVRATSTADGNPSLPNDVQAADAPQTTHRIDHQPQAAFMQSWHSGELEKLELRRRYVKARWWRFLNRIMAVLGLLILGAIIALIVVALKYHL